MTPDELVERVAKAMWMACDWGPMLKPYEEVREADKRVIRMEARAAIAVALEEAAKVCDEIETAEHRKWKQYADMMAQGASDGAGDCAAAIRALIKKESA